MRDLCIPIKPYDCLGRIIPRPKYAVFFIILMATLSIFFKCKQSEIDKIIDLPEYDEYSYETLLNTFHNVNRVNNHPFKYIFDPYKVCSNNIKGPDLLILVKSDVTHFSYRMGIRKTWGNFSITSLRLVFLIGYSSTIQNFVANEYERYHDLVQEDFIDAYHNNTYKTIMAFNWATSSCPGTKHLLFVDDDYFVNVNGITEYLKVNGSLNNYMFAGNRVENARVFRYIESQWYMTKENYPFMHYPPYISGGAILLSMKTAMIMKNIFPYIRYIYVDDVFLGISAYILHISLIHDDRFSLIFAEDNLNNCLVAHDYGSPDNLIRNWKNFLRRHYDNTADIYRLQVNDIMTLS